MYQCAKNVEEYFKEMEVTIISAQIVEPQELHEYTSLSTLVHQASKVEFQLRKHGRKSYPTTSSNWKSKEKKKRNSLERTKVPRRGLYPLKAIVTSNIKCSKCLEKGHISSQCPKKRTMILRDDGKVDSESPLEETSTSGSKGHYSDDVLFEGELLMTNYNDGVTNKFSFVHKGKKATLKPLTPREVIKDQLWMKKR
ncbi:hypothetical protein CR513_32768, partial [Mucuna pruriens]